MFNSIWLRSSSKLFLAVIMLSLLILQNIGLERVVQATPVSPNANQGIPDYNDSFRLGINNGFRNPNWNNRDLSDAAAGLGVSSLRVRLPEIAMQNFGDGFALPDMQRYQANQQRNLTAFLIGPSREHSTAPAGIPDWQLDYYAPKNLDERIWNDDGSVNPNNHWASYVARAVKTYKPYVKIWEIWNEPDFIEISGVNESWYTSPPAPATLTHWNESVYKYVRMLRISYEVIKREDPSALVATGGLGYDGFLDAILRYTDNPLNGAVTSDNPNTGGAYFDVLSYHYYPQYGVLSQQTQKWEVPVDSDGAADKLITSRNNFRQILEKYGYGTSKPAKYFIVTETGVSSKTFPVTLAEKTVLTGSMDLLRNYSMKAQVLARTNDLKQLHFYMLTDEETDSAATASFKHMGMYYDNLGVNPGAAIRKSASYGMETIARSLEGATYEAQASNSLSSLPNTRGAIFRAANGQRLTVLWAWTKDNSEAATATIALPAQANLQGRNWDWAQTHVEQTLTPANGLVTLNLTASPTVLVGEVITQGLKYYPLSKPIRLYDSREHGPLAAATPFNLKGNNFTRAGVTIPASAQALTGNFHIINDVDRASGYANLYPAGNDVPQVANIVYTEPNQIIADAFTVGLGADGSFNVYSMNRVNFVLDINGYYAPPGAGGLYYHALPKPVRVLETRPNQVGATSPGRPLEAQTALKVRGNNLSFDGVSLPASARALSGAITALNDQGGGWGFATVFPGDKEWTGTADILYAPSRYISNGFVVTLGGDGTFKVLSQQKLNFIVDVTGYYSEEANDQNGSGLLYYSLSKPVRLYETRPGASGYYSPGAALAVNSTTVKTLSGISYNQVFIPPTARALVGTAAAISHPQTGFTYLTLYPSGANQPLAANLVCYANQIIAGAFTVGLDARGQLSFYSLQYLHLALDISGYFAV